MIFFGGQVLGGQRPDSQWSRFSLFKFCTVICPQDLTKYFFLGSVFVLRNVGRFPATDSRHSYHTSG